VSALGPGCVKTGSYFQIHSDTRRSVPYSPTKPYFKVAISALGLHCLHQWPNTHDIDHSFKIISKDMQTHFRTHMLECFHLKVGVAHPGFDGAKGMFDGFSSYSYSLRLTIQSCLNRINYCFVFPATDSTRP